VQDAVLGREISVMERALDALREALALAEELAGQAVQQHAGIGTAAVRLAEAEAGEGARRIEIDGEDGAEIAVQRAQRVAGAEGEPRRDRRRLVADLAIPLGDAAGEEESLEAGIEVPRELHERVAQQPLARAGGHGDGGGLGGMDDYGLELYQ